uniref:Aromatic-L-amino-acid decarboxylase n=1 Tax=Meloidogyne hapla TaxID=6305 RepID=A0A1I8B4U1_MELHA
MIREILVKVIEKPSPIVDPYFITSLEFLWVMECFEDDKLTQKLSFSSSTSTATPLPSSTSGVPTSNFVPSPHGSITQMNKIEQLRDKINEALIEGQNNRKRTAADQLLQQIAEHFSKVNLNDSRKGSSNVDDSCGSSRQRLGAAKSTAGMNAVEFRRRGRQMVDYITDYMENIENRRVVPSIEPGYLKELLPLHAPQTAEPFERLLQDFESYIMPGVTHWTHPRFHAYFPAGNSFPSILADMLSDALGAIGFSWAACPAMTELEIHMLQWLGEMIGLPVAFLPFTENGTGGGVIQVITVNALIEAQSSASECNFVALLAARFEIMKELRQRFPFVEEGLLMSKLIAYCSKEAHSSVEKAAMIAMIKLRILETDSSFRLRGETLQTAVSEDRNLGLIPFFVSTTLGTTSCCSFDVLSEVGPVCTHNGLWLHVDAAYAGSAMICPEFRYLMAGIEHAMSFNTNPNKWMLVNRTSDYRHWGIPLSRRFRSLKLWFVIRSYGIEGLQRYIREHVRLAKLFECLLLADDQLFEVVAEVLMGLVCFRMKASDELNQLLLTKLNSSGRIHMVPASLNDRFVIRFCVCYENATERDIQIAYEIIKQTAMSLREPIPEPIAENYELEMEEAEQYDQMMQDKQKNRNSPNIELNRNSSLRRQSIGSSSINTPSYPQQQQNLQQNIQQMGNSPLAIGIGSEQTIGGHSPSSLTSSTGADRRRLHTLAEKRSFLVRMVSDPKCYNPKIVRHLNMRAHNQTSAELFRDRTLRQAIQQGSFQQRSSLGAGTSHGRIGANAPFSSGKYACMSIDQGSDEDDYQSLYFQNDQNLGI